MKRRYFRPLTLAAAVFFFLMLTGVQARADKQAELDAAIKKIDMKLYKQSEADVRAWLDKMIEVYGDFGVYPPLPLRIEGDKVTVGFSRGAICDPAAQFFRAYEMLGDRKYLEAGLKTADLVLAVQLPMGLFAGAATIQRNGKITPHPVRGNVVRIQDFHQSRPGALLFYAYKLTGDKKYFEGAKRCADAYAGHVQNHKWGWCPDSFNVAKLNPAGHYGSYGGSYNDFATSDGMRITIMMYHLTKDKKYLKRTAKIGNWMFATQLGKGKVRGWCQQYKADNTAAGARHHEAAILDGRCFTRFMSPMLTWFYAMTGQQRYRTLLEETYQWMKSVEKPDDHPKGGGWACGWLPDGSEVFSWRNKAWRYDRRETWPADAPHWGGKYGRSKVWLFDTEPVLAQLKSGGLEALRKWYRGPTKYSPEEYTEARLAAARRSIDNQMNVLSTRGGLYPYWVHDKQLDQWLAKTSWSEGGPRARYLPLGKYLDVVRRRQMRLDTPDLDPDKFPFAKGRSGIHRQAWVYNGWRFAYGVPSWQFVWDVRLALGQIDPDRAAEGGRGLRSLFPSTPWGVMGDWTARAIEVESWLDIPLGEFD